MDPENNTRVSDLERFKETAKTRRELAWDLLKETRNPEYVALRYGYPIQTMREALAKIPERKEQEIKAGRNYSKTSAGYKANEPRRASEFIPTPEREPGCDDDIGEEDSL